MRLLTQISQELVMSSIALSFDNVDLVSIDNGEPKTTSLAVAKKFGKRHGDILRAIKRMDCSKEFAERNFALCFKINDLQNGKKQPFYSMTKDGFVFLVMGFTGKVAAKFKEDYINEFNRMTDKLNGNIGTLLERHNAKSGILKRGKEIASDCGYNLWFYGQVVNPKVELEIADIEKELQPLLTGFESVKRLRK